MKSYIVSFLLLTSPLAALASAPSLNAMAFAAKHQINSDLFKNAHYEQGDSFALGKSKTAYKLFFSGKYQGRNAVMQINCKADNKSGDIEYCKPINVK